MKLYKFITDWILIFAILTGVLGYLIYANIPALDATHHFALEAVGYIQPILIFCMLFLTFCRVNFRQLRLCRYHWWLLAFQCGLFIAIAIVLTLIPRNGTRIILEGAMLCLICPTATAGAVITKKLGGDPSHIVTYTILINLAASLIIPATLPYVHPIEGLSVSNASMLILGKVFPLLLLPLVAAAFVKQFFHKIHQRLLGYPELSFRLWVVALALAMAVTTRYLVHSHVDLSVQLWLVAVSLLSCILQFWIGRRIGSFYNDTVTAGQSLGQKNTVLAIWLGSTFFTPITSLAGGFYSIWHNVINSWQLYNHKKHT